jgi:methyl-accepting chemotaxis protein
MGVATMRQRLSLGFGTMIMLIGLGAGVGIWFAGEIGARVGTLISEDLRAQRAIQTASLLAVKLREDQQQFLLTSKVASIDEAIRTGARLEETLIEVRGRLAEAGDRARLDQVLVDVQAIRGQLQSLRDASIAMGLDEDLGLRADLRGAAHEIEDEIERLDAPELRVLLLMARRHEKDYMLRGDPQYVDRLRERLEEFRAAAVREGLAAPLRSRLDGLWLRYFASFGEFVALHQSILFANDELAALSARIQAANDELGDGIATHARDTERAVFALMEDVTGLLLVVLLVAVVAGVVIAAWIINSITSSVASARGVIARISVGELSFDRDELRSRDEIGQMLTNIDAMKTRLAEIATLISSGSREVIVSAEQVSMGNALLNQRTGEQASSLEEIAASMEQMTGSVEQNAERARRADDLAARAQMQASGGGAVVERAVESMGAIEESSRRIADIIGVIDEIAFQTNLLALNAAVEAARAGDQGRGFAVVAAEVRALAGRSAEAAREIRTLIGEGVTRIRDGSGLVSATGLALEEIVASVTELSELVGEIAVASGQQASAIGQVNNAVFEMDRMTQQNASMVEEVAAASEVMGSRAHELEAAIGFFKLDDGSPD